MENTPHELGHSVYAKDHARRCRIIVREPAHDIQYGGGHGDVFRSGSHKNPLG